MHPVVGRGEARANVPKGTRPADDNDELVTLLKIPPLTQQRQGRHPHPKLPSRTTYI